MLRSESDIIESWELGVDEGANGETPRGEFVGDEFGGGMAFYGQL